MKLKGMWLSIVTQFLNNKVDYNLYGKLRVDLSKQTFFYCEIMKNITIKGARLHNLKGIDISIPKNKLIVVTGVSGSGKSSLVFDIIFKEGRRQYLQSLGVFSGIDDETKFDNI